MKNNLPTVQKEGFFKRIANWFNKLIRKKEEIIETVDVVAKEHEFNNKAETHDDKFVKALNSLTAKVEVDTEIKNVIEEIFDKIQKRKMQLEELSNEELCEIIEIYKREIEEKTIILNKLKNNTDNNEEE